MFEHPVQPVHGTFPQGKSNEDEVHKSDEYEVEGVFEDSHGPFTSLQLNTTLLRLLVNVVDATPSYSLFHVLDGIEHNGSRALHDALFAGTTCRGSSRLFGANLDVIYIV
jgi:hypothetical protein